MERFIQYFYQNKNINIFHELQFDLPKHYLDWQLKIEYK